MWWIILAVYLVGAAVSLLLCKHSKKFKHRMLEMIEVFEGYTVASAVFLWPFVSLVGIVAALFTLGSMIGGAVNKFAGE